MALRSGYGPEHPELEPFLLTEIGEDPNGLAVTMQSALARLDLDPQAEAHRLRALPRVAALNAIAKVVGALPAGNWDGRGSYEVAADLLARLPRAQGGLASTSLADPESRAPHGLPIMRILLCAGFAALAAYAIWSTKEEASNYMDLSMAPFVEPAPSSSVSRSGHPAWVPYAVGLRRMDRDAS